MVTVASLQTCVSY